MREKNNSKPVEAVRNTANEVLDMIRAVVGRKGRLDIPVVGSKYMKKISQRQALQESNPGNAGYKQCHSSFG